VIFVDAAMLSSGQSTLHVFSQQVSRHSLSWAHEISKISKIQERLIFTNNQIIKSFHHFHVKML
jgi:hypothetical protein